jgi:hypothetical protein
MISHVYMLSSPAIMNPISIQHRGNFLPFHPLHSSQHQPPFRFAASIFRSRILSSRKGDLNVVESNSWIGGGGGFLLGLVVVGGRAKVSSLRMRGLVVYVEEEVDDGARWRWSLGGFGAEDMVFVMVC